RVPWMKTAPSWSGEYGRKTLTRRSADTWASSGTPSSAYWRSPVERSTTSSAPMRRPDSDSTALTISSVTCARSSPDAPSRAWPTRPWPRLASARRSSGPKSTTRATTQNGQKLSSSHTVEERSSRRARGHADADRPRELLERRQPREHRGVPRIPGDRLVPEEADARIDDDPVFRDPRRPRPAERLRQKRHDGRDRRGARAGGSSETRGFCG